MRLVPDRRYVTKAVMSFLTLTLFLALVAGAITLAIWTFSTDLDVGDAAAVVWSITGTVALALWLVGLPIAWLWIRNLGYEIEPDKVVISKGILSKIRQSIPLRMVTDFRLNRSLYDRWLGIGSIEIQTAGQSQSATGYEGRLAGLEDWAEIHERLRHMIEEIDALPPTAAQDGGDLRDLVADVHRIRELLESRR